MIIAFPTLSGPRPKSCNSDFKFTVCNFSLASLIERAAARVSPEEEEEREELGRFVSALTESKGEGEVEEDSGRPG
jgi:hypothetical protein